MLAEERKGKIIDIIEKNKIARVTDLSKLLSATEATVRRDLDELQRLKKVQRVHGGAMLATSTNQESSESELSTLCIKEKEIIAVKAFEFICDNDVLLLDASTTVYKLASLLLDGKLTGVSVITNSFNIINLLRNSGTRVIHTGGYLNPRMNYAYGTVTEQMLSDLRVDKCFLGTNGIDPSYGYSVPTFEDASVKKAMLVSSKLKFILADHTKFGEAYMAKFANYLGDIDYVITDNLPDHFDCNAFDPNASLIIADTVRLAK